MVRRRNVCGLALLALALTVSVFTVRMASANETRAGAQCYHFAIQGMTCDECTVHVQKALAKVPGVAEARVIFIKREAVVCTKSGANTQVAWLLEAVEKAGYKATLKR